MENVQKILKLFIFLVIIVPFIYFILVYLDCYKILQNHKDFDPYLSTKIYDVNNNLISELFEENRSYIVYKDIPENIKTAFLAAEDRNFYWHNGIDFLGIMRALAIDIFSGEIKYGGSTITQQLAKQLYTKRARTFKRKILELFIVSGLERRYSKNKILEMYLNQIYFGHGVYGIKSAARFYFDSEIEKLGIIESAVLASIPSAPNRYSPLLNPRLSFKRNKKILYNIIYAGFISKTDAAQLFNRFWAEYLIKIKDRYPTLGIRNKRFDKAPYFTEYIRRKLVKKYGKEKIYRKGLKIYTTLDLRHQKIARDLLVEAIEKQNRLAYAYNKYKLMNLDRVITKKIFLKNKRDLKDININIKFLKKFRKDFINEVSLAQMIFGINGAEKVISKKIEEIEKFKASSQVEGAFISMDPGTGGITSMVGGSDSNSANQLNRAVQSVRQPGSAFKAFIYGAGLESKKITLAKSFMDLPLFFKGTGKDKDWSPSNYGKSFQGRVLARKAFALSVNTASVITYQLVGGNRIADFAAKIMGLSRKRFEIDPTLALGTTELSPLELTRGFAVIANNGISSEPFSIRYILNGKGKKIYDGESISRKKRKRVISPGTAFLMTSMMRGVIDYGTARHAVRGIAGFRLPAAGKTGTNTNFRDAWFAGFTPNLVATVWIGCDKQKFTLMPGQSGAVAAAPVWGKFMKSVYGFRKKSWFRGKPGSISTALICSKTGNLAVKGCVPKKEFFLAGTVPEIKCDLNHSDIVNIFKSARKKKTEMFKGSSFMNKENSDE